MAHRGLLYVSKTCLDTERSDDEVADIVSKSIARNRALGVTGALLFTGAYFAQRLEGPKESIDELMLSISADRRHKCIRVADDGLIEMRDFSDWNMAYSGQSSFVESHVIAVFTAAESDLCTESRRLLRLMQEFQI